VFIGIRPSLPEPIVLHPFTIIDDINKCISQVNGSTSIADSSCATLTLGRKEF